MKFIKVNENMVGRRLDRVVQKLNPSLPMSMIFKLIRKKAIRVNGKRTEPNYLILSDDLIQYPTFSQEKVKDKPMYKPGYQLDILYEDDAIIVIDKPSGLASQGGTNIRFNAIAELEAKLKSSIYPIHRLDQGTSGCMLFAKHASSARMMAEQFHDRQVEKTYLAGIYSTVYLQLPLTIDNAYFTQKEINDPFDIEARTTILEQSRFEQTSLLKVLPQTGRKHQIRIHLAALGTPIIGDRQYGLQASKRQRLMLHAQSLFIHVNQKPILIQSRLTEDFVSDLKALDKIK